MGELGWLLGCLAAGSLAGWLAGWLTGGVGGGLLRFVAAFGIEVRTLQKPVLLDGSWHCLAPWLLGGGGAEG